MTPISHTATKSPGQLAYEEDVRRMPYYPSGTCGPRQSWELLEPAVRQAWEKNPTPRGQPKAKAQIDAFMDEVTP